MRDLKEALRKRCISSVQQRLAESREAIMQLQQALHSETKSTAGDKYETGRAMAQLEIEKHSGQVADASAQLAVLQSISAENTPNTVQLGSLVTTNHGKFYMSVSAGAFQLDSERYFAISPKSPVGKSLSGLKVGDSFPFNGKTYEVLELV